MGLLRVLTSVNRPKEASFYGVSSMKRNVSFTSFYLVLTRTAHPLCIKTSRTIVLLFSSDRSSFFSVPDRLVPVRLQIPLSSHFKENRTHPASVGITTFSLLPTEEVFSIKPFIFFLARRLRYSKREQRSIPSDPIDNETVRCIYSINYHGPIVDSASNSVFLFRDSENSGISVPIPTRFGEA